MGRDVHLSWKQNVPKPPISMPLAHQPTSPSTSRAARSTSASFLWHYCNCCKINSTDVSQLQVLPHPCMGPHKESRHEKCSRGRGRCCYSPPRGSSSWKSPGLPVCRDIGMTGTRPLHQHCKLPERTLGRKQPVSLSCAPHSNWMEYLCMHKGSFCAAEGYIFHFCLAGSIGNSRRKRGQQKLLCRLT